MSIELVGLAVLMGLVTYPSRAIPLLVPGFERLPAVVHSYLRLVGPAMLASLAAAGVLFVADEPGIRIGIELVAVLACVAIVAWRGSLLIGIAAAVAMVAVARAIGLA
jgi:branched-subunit amino acid transport protein